VSGAHVTNAAFHPGVEPKSKSKFAKKGRFQSGILYSYILYGKEDPYTVT